MDGTIEKLILLRSGPGTPEAAGALVLATCLQARGRRVTIVLVQDAVLAGVRTSHLESAKLLRGLLDGRATCYYLDEDLAMRGYGPTDALPGCRAVGYSELVDLLLAEGTSATGAF